MGALIGVLGHGFVGKAVREFFEGHGHQVRVYDKDPDRSTHVLAETCSSEFVFVCVPTPTLGGIQDQTALEEVGAALIQWASPSTTVVIKSTVLPGTTRRLATSLKSPVIFSPEFLTARTASYDFAHPDSIILGGHDTMKVEALLTQYHPDVPVMRVSWETAELIKYARNTFYAVKVGWWNEVFDLCEALDVDYEVVKQGVLASGWVNPMHCEVPGPDGQRGFGGACLPKDSEALVGFANQHGVDLSILKTVLTSNRKHRNLEAM
jgi:UDPglucose 6-dehydrogenase